MKLFVFTNKEFGNIAVAAENADKAMHRVKKFWYEDYFNCEFSMIIVESLSCVQLLDNGE